MLHKPSFEFECSSVFGSYLALLTTNGKALIVPKGIVNPQWTYGGQKPSLVNEIKL